MNNTYSILGGIRMNFSDSFFNKIEKTTYMLFCDT